MSLREALYQAARTYCILVTLITMAILVLGETFDAGATFSYDVFLSPLVFALVGAVPELVMVSREELSRRAYVCRRVAQFVLVEAGSWQSRPRAPRSPRTARTSSSAWWPRWRWSILPPACARTSRTAMPPGR